MISFEQTRIRVRFDIQIEQEEEARRLIERLTVLVDLATAILLVIAWPFWTLARLGRWLFGLVRRLFGLPGQLFRRLKWWVSDQVELFQFMAKVVSIHLVSYGYGLGLCRSPGPRR